MIDKFPHLGYNDGKADADDDIKTFGIRRAKIIAVQLETNVAFSETYKTGYANTVSSYKKEK